MRRHWRAFRRHPLGLAGAAIVAVLCVAALGAPLFAHDNPLRMHMLDTLQPPSTAHWLGTDEFGRDEWSRVLYGVRLSFAVGLYSMLLAVAVGLPLGAVAGFEGGALDAVLMRIMDAILAFPAILLAIGLVASLGPGTTNAIIAIGFVYTPVLARVTRGAVLARRHEDFVDAARAMGQSSWGILRVHVLPNCVAPIVVQGTLGFASAIVIEASLSFLGAGTPPPTPSWGSMLNEARQFMVAAPFTAIVPGAAISVAVLGINLLGDAMRDILDPRLRG